MKIVIQLLVLVMGWETLASAASDDTLQSRDDLKLLIPIQYKPCIELLDRLGDSESTITLCDSIPLIHEQAELISCFKKDNKSPFYSYIEQQQPILANEMNQLEQLHRSESGPGDEEYEQQELESPSSLYKAFRCLRTQAIDLNVRRVDIDSEAHSSILLGQYFCIMDCYETLLCSQPFHLPEIISLSAHKILYMCCISPLLDRIRSGISLNALWSFRGLDVNSNKPFIQVFDENERGMNAYRLCGSKIFGYVRAMKPYIKYATDDEIRGYLTEYQGKRDNIPPWRQW
ncbi:MAG: hypothetical protein NTX76_03650 [Alphaproteobacteria bacterium]|nr:hypothetical protein [Alphaproteobacteria bacterium]